MSVWDWLVFGIAIVWLWGAAFFCITTTHEQWRDFYDDFRRHGFAPLSILMIAIAGFLSWPLVCVSGWLRSKRRAR
jgi:uncharacterized membrane protein YdjX (TVP38/TMEM64 family)